MRRFYVAYRDIEDNIFTIEVVLYKDEKANENTFMFKMIDIENVHYPYEILSWSLVEE